MPKSALSEIAADKLVRKRHAKLMALVFQELETQGLADEEVCRGVLSEGRSRSRSRSCYSALLAAAISAR